MNKTPKYVQIKNNNNNNWTMLLHSNYSNFIKIAWSRCFSHSIPHLFTNPKDQIPFIAYIFKGQRYQDKKEKPRLSNQRKTKIFLYILSLLAKITVLIHQLRNLFLQPIIFLHQQLIHRRQFPIHSLKA